MVAVMGVSDLLFLAEYQKKKKKKKKKKKTAWLRVWFNVQICIWPSWCHCHSLSLAPINPDWFYLPGSTFLVLAYPGSPGQNPTGL